ncbi:hypothetical protein N7507_000521 [Penicillium longicatenatum]|nr:hypothetical protein N7507_000521 [Penicillium longicatenatum]
MVRIVTQPRLGMTKRIARAADRAHATIHFPVCMLGPYGHSPPLGQYGTVIFVLEDHPYWVGDEISQIPELDRMFDRDDCPEHGHRDDRGFDQILQFTTHILGARPVYQIRYRNRTRLKYRFEAMNIAKDLACLMDSTGGMTAVSVCASNPIRAAIHHIVHTRTFLFKIYE